MSCQRTDVPGSPAAADPTGRRHRAARALPVFAMVTGSGWVSAALVAASAPAAALLNRRALTGWDRAVTRVVPPADGPVRARASAR